MLLLSEFFVLLGVSVWSGAYVRFQSAEQAAWRTAEAGWLDFLFRLRGVLY